MKKYFKLFGILCVVIFGVYLLSPPYLFPSLAYFWLNDNALEKSDTEFRNSEKDKWKDTNLRVYPIFKTKVGARLYHIGSYDKYGRRYEIAYLKGAEPIKTCKPSLLFSEEKFFKCDIPLSDGWSINYESMLNNAP